MAPRGAYVLALLAIAVGTGLYFLPPNAYSFARFTYSQFFEDNQSRGQVDNRESALLELVQSTAAESPEGVLEAFDKFAWSQEWLMCVGDRKGKILDEEIRKRQPKTVLELGGYLGYSGIRMGAKLSPGGKLYSVDVNPKNVEIAKKVIAHAGLNDQIVNLVGTLDDVLEDLKKLSPTFDLVFIDHHKAVYLKDLQTLLREGFLKENTIIIADNVRNPGAPDYLKFVESDPHFGTTRHEAMVEYNHLVPDLVTVSTYKGSS